MPLPWMPLVAAGLDWLEGLLPLLFVLFWIVSQVWGVFRKVAGNGDAKPPRPVPRPAARPVPQAPWLEEEPAQDEAAIRRELEQQIEGFLRESGRQPRPESPARPAPPSRTSRRQPARPRPAAPSAPQPPAAGASGRSRGERGVGAFAERVSDIARHVEDAFADDLVHRKGLAPIATEPAAAPAAPVTMDLVAALRDPATLRQLILVREVLDRPTERW